MGTGTNVQKRLVALHHLDAPWKPAEVEQREGRILRQGNGNEEVAIYRYVTEGSFDAYMWQALETKARFISQVMTGDNAARRAEDIGGQELSYAEVKAIASGNPAVLTLAEADAELQRLAILKKNHADEQYLARRAMRELPETIARLTKRAGRPHGRPGDACRPCATIRSPSASGACSRSDALGHALAAGSTPCRTRCAKPRRYPLGRYRGLAFGMVLHPGGAADVFLEGAATRHGHAFPRPSRPACRAQRPRPAGRQLRRPDATPPARTWRSPRASSATTRPASAGPSRHDAYLAELTGLRDQLKAGLSQATPEPGTHARCRTGRADQGPESRPHHRRRPRADGTPPHRRRGAGDRPHPPPYHGGTRHRAAGRPGSSTAGGNPPAAADTPTSAEEPMTPAVIALFPNGKPAASARPQPGYRQHVTRTRRQDARQLSLF